MIVQFLDESTGKPIITYDEASVPARKETVVFGYIPSKVYRVVTVQRHYPGPDDAIEIAYVRVKENTGGSIKEWQKKKKEEIEY